VDISTKEEIITDINSLKTDTATGQDNINTNLFKANPELTAYIIFLIPRHGQNTRRMN